MVDQQLDNKAIVALNGHKKELESMQQSILQAAASNSTVGNIKEIYLVIVEATSKCAAILNSFDKKTPIPLEVKDAIIDVQNEISNTIAALLNDPVTISE